MYICRYVGVFAVNEWQGAGAESQTQYLQLCTYWTSMAVEKPVSRLVMLRM